MKLINFFKKICYEFLCIFYRFLIYIFYKIKFIGWDIQNLKFKCLRFTFAKELKAILKLENKKILKSRFQDVFILNNIELGEILEFIFNNEFKEFLFKKNNCCFSVDYISIYKNKYLTDKEKKKSIYANLMHIDKPFSKYTLKLFIPINVKNKKYGPLEIKVNQPLKLPQKYIEKDYIKLYSEDNKTNLFLFNPSQNFHRACVPINNSASINIIMQLNPSKNWSYSSDIFKRQFKIEPNFPEIRNLFSKRILL